MPNLSQVSQQIVGASGGTVNLSTGGTATATGTYGLNPGGGSSATRTMIAALIARITSGGTPPSVNPTVQPQWSPDGTHYYNDGGPWSPTMAATTSYDFTYLPPPCALDARLVITAGDANVITAIAWGCSTENAF